MSHNDFFDQKIKHLIEEVKKGTVTFAEGMNVLDAFQNIKYDKNGKVIPESVDPMINSLANTVQMHESHKILKSVSLKFIQEEYFRFLELFFSEPYNEMIKHGLAPYMIAEDISKNEKLVHTFYSEISEFEKKLNSFWDKGGPVIEAHMLDMKGLKTVYGGSLFPDYEKNLISRAGLYFDTIVLPDPLLKILPMFHHMPPNKAMYFLINSVLTALSMKEVILADVNPPIAIIAPDAFCRDDSIKDYIRDVSEKDIISHIEYIFQKTFRNISEADRFLQSMSDIKILKSNIKNPERLLFDTDWQEFSLEKQIEYGFKDTGINESELYKLLRISITGRMMQANDLVFKSSQINGVPILDAPTSWEYFIWKYEYDNNFAQDVFKDFSNIVISRSLLDNKLLWMGDVPYKELIEIRKKGELNELRESLFKGIVEIQDASDSAYEEKIENAIKAIEGTLQNHQTILVECKNNFKKYLGYDVTPWLVTGGISIAAASTGNIPLSLISAATNMLGCSNGKELWQKGKELMGDINNIKRAPMGMLLNVYEKSGE